MSPIAAVRRAVWADGTSAATWKRRRSSVALPKRAIRSCASCADRVRVQLSAFATSARQGGQSLGPSPSWRNSAAFEFSWLLSAGSRSCPGCELFLPRLERLQASKRVVEIRVTADVVLGAARACPPSE
jgi:hypothetical protein